MSALGDGGPHDDGGQYGDGAPEPYAGQGGPEQPEWLDRIHARMDELRDSTAAIAAQLAPREPAYGQDDYAYELDDDEHGYETEFDDEPDALNTGIDDDEPDIIDVISGRIDDAISRREAAADAQAAVQERNWAFEDLREELPLLQDPQLAGAIVRRAFAKAQRWDPGLVERAEFVDLIESEALAYIGRRAREQQPSGAAQPDVVLESASGSAPQQQSQTDDAYWGDRMLAAAQRLRPSI